MKSLIFVALLAVICVQSEGQNLLNSLTNFFNIAANRSQNQCERDPIPILKDALNDFAVRLTKRASYYSNNGHFIISPTTIWLSLASLAEFADRSVQTELFAALNLPQERCIRIKMYQYALALESPGPDVRFDRSRALAIDQQANVNRDWLAFSDTSKILKCLPVSFDDETFSHVSEYMSLPGPVALNGHSVLLDRLEYDGLWTSAFAEGTIEQAPFYNDLGQEIATVDYMRMKSRVRLAHIPIIDAKVLELPVGSGGRYTMLFTMGVRDNTIKRILDLLMNSIILDIMSALTLSLVPIEVAIPKFSLSNGYDAKPMLDDMGLGRIFADPAATRYVSDPPATPCGYLQRVSINITTATLGARNSDSPNVLSGFFNMASNAATGLATAVGRDFIASRPFLYTLIDTKTRIPVFTGVFSYPERQIEPMQPYKLSAMPEAV